LIADSELSNGCLLEDVLLLIFCFSISFLGDVDVASFFFRKANPPLGTLLLVKDMGDEVVLPTPLAIVVDKVAIISKAILIR